MWRTQWRNPIFLEAYHWFRQYFIYVARKNLEICRRKFFLSDYSRGASQMALVVKNPSANAGDIRDRCSILRSGRPPGEGNGYPLQYSCPENPIDRGSWWANLWGNKQSDMTERLTLSLSWHLLAVRHWASYRTFLCLSLFICNIKKITVVPGS